MPPRLKPGEVRYAIGEHDELLAAYEENGQVRERLMYAMLVNACLVEPNDRRTTVLGLELARPAREHGPFGGTRITPTVRDKRVHTAKRERF